MINPQLLDYVRQQQTAGISKEDIRKSLTTQGWSEQDLNEVFAAVAPVAANAVPVPEPKHAAIIGKRFWENVIDIILLYILALVVDLVIIKSTTSLSAFLLGWAAWLVYFTFFEAIWQRTPGKWMMKTKVVKLDGTKPGFWRIVGRSLCRYIPFDALSYLFGRYPYGWHDRISKTMIVPASYTVSEAALVDPHNKGKSRGGIVALIVVIFAIPVLGILSSIILVALNGARQKGADAAITADMTSLQIQSILYQTENNSYQGFCSSPEAISELQDASQLGVQAPTSYDCNDSADNWAASVPLRSTGYLCTDASSTQPIDTVSDLGAQTTCSGM
jgi:uncharacterized RDD family membrane protein YckC/type II secretory pathway pseudopilin PulG